MKNIWKPNLVSVLFTIMLAVLMISPAAAEQTVTLPDYSMPLLSPASQAASAWTNVIPNALASYFTYVPYSTVDAVKLGFPSTCGNPALGTPADLASTEDCYTITAKSFNQQLALPGIFGGGAGLLDANGGAFGAATRVYGYGSGGQNWSPPGAPAGVTVTGNAPAPFSNGALSTAGIWHFPAPTIKGKVGRPIRIQWLNELPNVMPDGFDPTVYCGPNAQYCFPYNRIVTHVHGAHVPGDSDGLATAWYTPGFAIKGPGWIPSTHGPEGTYRYPTDSEASTIWYHDHAVGVTHNNTQMGLAGFHTITDAIEQALVAANILPTGNYELGFALQDRMFNTTGQFQMPDYPVYDLNSPGCTLTVDGLADPATCTRLDWMKDPADGHLIPYVPGHPFLLDPINAGAPFPAASTTLEYFGNMPVVNGVTYGKYDVEPRIYRMRFIGGTDSRTWIMKLVSRATGTVVPFWQIGTEQGLLEKPVRRETMDLMSGERLDVLVDLTGIAAGTKIVMQNIGPDAPYAGPDMLLDPAYAPSVDIPEIMEFNVVPLVGTDAILAPSATTVLRAPIVQLVPTPGVPIRVVSLVEETDRLGRTMPSIDGRGYLDLGIPPTEIVRLNDIEEWDIVNSTVDAHPMHLHLVAFQVINRQAFDPQSFVPAGNDIPAGIYTPPQYQNAPGSEPIPPAAWEAGWKDTIDCPPGMVTRVRAKFDIASDRYVWHCHILSHEEHDMMRPLVVYDPAGCNDFNNCTADTFDSVTGKCVFTPVVCPTGQTCDVATGHCVSCLTSFDCNDGLACTADTCDPAQGICVHAPIICADNNVCTTDSCDPATGTCVHAPVVCNDNNACTIDKCNTGTGCYAVPVVIDDLDPCTIDACDPATGVITHTAIVCNDNNACTADMCVNGVCVFTPVIVCNDNDACTIDSCNPATGVCEYLPKCAPGEICVDGICYPACPAGSVQFALIRGGGQKPTGADLQIQTSFTVMNPGGCITSSTDSTVTVSPGTILLFNCKQGVGPNPTSGTWLGKPIPTDTNHLIVCPAATGEVGKLTLDNKLAVGGKDIDRMTISVQ